MANALILYGHQDPIGPAGGGQPFSRWFQAEHPYHEGGALTSICFDRDVTPDEQAAVERAVTETDRYWNDHGKDAPRAPRGGRHIAVDVFDAGYLVTAHDGDLEAGTPVAAATFADVCKAIQAALQLPK